ncbi:MAG: hypothetical protein ACRDAJ_06855 [Serratia fonticola]
MLTKEAAKALEKSIAHWVENYCLAVDGKANRMSVTGDDCALCTAFASYEGCDGCPVLRATGHHRCVATPYAAIASAEFARAPKSKQIALVKAELEFLESLRD